MPPEVQQALALWEMPDATARLAAHRENTVWRVSHAGRDLALRFHRAGYRTAAELTSELRWMAYLAGGGLTVPAPVAMPDGGLIGAVAGQNVSLLTWLPGRPIGVQGDLRGIDDPVALSRRLGRAMARLHDLSDAMPRPAGFTRPDWRRDGLLGEAPLWGRFWDHPHLAPDQRALLLDARAAADAALACIEDTADQGLIHADLLGENILIDDGGRLGFIDFDDGAFGFRDFDLATFLFRFQGHPMHADMSAAICDGYGARRPVDPRQLDLFVLLRALTYPGWIADRLDEPGAADRSARALCGALTLAAAFLKRRPT